MLNFVKGISINVYILTHYNVIQLTGFNLYWQINKQFYKRNYFSHFSQFSVHASFECLSLTSPSLSISRYL